MKNQFKKTYGVEGLIDWQAQLKAGKACLVVTFTGGGLTSYGVTPAQYTTENILFQKIIENSKEFKSGRIKLLRSVQILDYLKDIVTDVTPVEIAEIQKPKLDQIRDVYNCSDATLWLKEHKGVNTVGKNKRQIIEIAATHGVEFPALMQ